MVHSKLFSHTHIFCLYTLKHFVLYLSYHISNYTNNTYFFVSGPFSSSFSRPYTYICILFIACIFFKKISCFSVNKCEFYDFGHDEIVLAMVEEGGEN